MTELRDKIKIQEFEMRKAIYGMDEIIKIFCLAKASDLSVLLLGEHAVAKSTLARLWSYSAGLDFRVVTSSEVDESLIAYIDPAIFREKNIVQMRRGELMERDHILVDEFYLWSNKHRAKLHELLEERMYAGLSVLTKTYTFSSNPLTEYYAGQIEEYNMATSDRIDVVIPVFQPSIIPTQQMIRKFSEFGRKEKPLQPVIAWEDYLAARDEIIKVQVPQMTLVWLTLLAESMSACKYSESKFDVPRARMQKLCMECNEKEHLCGKVALSKPRFLRASVLLAKAMAWYDERDAVTIEDLEEAIKYTLPHRIVFLLEEKTALEARGELTNLLQIFNDDMSNWKSRGILEKLEDIMRTARDPKDPKFKSDEAIAIETEVQESLPMKNYVHAGVEYAQKMVKYLYLEKLKGSQMSTENLRVELAKSGLTSYDIDDIMETIITSNKALTFYLKLNRRDPAQLKMLAEMVIEIHQAENVKCKGIASLLKDFEKEVRFFSDLISISEEHEKVRITCTTPKLKIIFEKKVGDLIV